MKIDMPLNKEIRVNQNPTKCGLWHVIFVAVYNIENDLNSFQNSLAHKISPDLESNRKIKKTE